MVRAGCGGVAQRHRLQIERARDIPRAPALFASKIAKPEPIIAEAKRLRRFLACVPRKHSAPQMNGRHFSARRESKFAF